MWLDREIRFDVPQAQLAQRYGEKVFEIIPQVEDTKGNTGEVGFLMVTNLRIIWYTEQNNKINLSVGYDCVLNAEVSESQSTVKGNSVTLLLRTRY